jgi:hypothetical protein
MPTVRLTYVKDIDREGTDVVDVDESRARWLLNMRRGVLVADAAPAAAKRKPARRRKAT